MSALARPAADRIAAVDVVRLIAALWVMAWHFYFDGYHVRHYIGIRTPALESISQYGFLGVQVFFVISGLVISMSCQGRSPAQFVAARGIRLYPAYWICGAITLAVGAAWGGGWFGCGPACIAFNASMLNGFFDVPYLDPSYWSLAVELEFYLFVALAIWWRLIRHLYVLMLAWLALSALPQLGLQERLGFLYYGAEAMWAPFFACGVMLFLIRRDGWHLRYALALALAWLLALRYIAVDVASFSAIAVPGHPFSAWRGCALFSVFLALVAAMSLNRIALAPSRWTRLCGGTSYPLYLLHQVVGITLLNRWRGHVADPLLMAGVSLLVVVVAALIWRYAELPVQRRLQRALPGSTRRAPLAASR